MPTLQFIKEADFMNYNEAMTYIESRKSLGIRPGLERMYEFAERLGNPQNRIKTIHVAGTNGKGSVCAMLSAYLHSQGYTVGKYTSPYVSCFNEQIQINGEYISDEQLAQLIDKIKPIADEMDALDDSPTEYEILTAAAFLFFAEQNVDYAVIEVGLGGLEDATNIIASPVLSVITDISLDHVNILGSTLEKIAAQKAGIIKTYCPVVASPYNPDSVLNVIKAQAAASESRLIIPSPAVTDVSVTTEGTFFSTAENSVYTSLSGVHQVKNAVTALAALKVVLPDVAKNVSFECVHPARLEIISKEPLVIIDGAHNADGAKCLAQTLDLLLDCKAVGIMGMLADKDYQSAVQLLAPKFEKIFTLTPKNPRALSAERLAKCVSEYTDAESCDSAVEAISKAKACGKPLVVFGSLYLAEEIRPMFT